MFNKSINLFFIFNILFIILNSCQSKDKIEIVESTFGFIPYLSETEKNVEVKKFTLSNKSGLSVEIINYGATITKLIAPDRNGKLDDLVLGFDDIEGFLSEKNPYMGATLGRFANRIKDAKFTIDGNEYQLSANDGKNQLHGGIRGGFSKRIWEPKVLENRILFKLLSSDGEEGYPSNCEVTADFTLEGNKLIIEYTAGNFTKKTPINISNHPYFNLSGFNYTEEQLKDHFVRINANYYTPTSDDLIPTGEIKAVDGTVYDLREEKNIKEMLSKFSGPNSGYDINFCINKDKDENKSEMNLAARVKDEKSGRILTVYSDQPGVQFYTSNFLDGTLEGKGTFFQKHGAFSLETQNWPNAVNLPNFPNSVYGPGSTYKAKSIFEFSTDKM